MSKIETLESKEIYKNKWMRLREDRILRENGQEGIYSVVEKNDFVVVIAFDGSHIFVVEQFRYALQNHTIELPQGAWETKGDCDPLDLAKGELQEETGLIAGEMTFVGYQHLACGYSNQGYHIYLATQLTQGKTNLDDEEYGLTSRKVTITQFEHMIASGEISDASSVLAYLLAKHKGLLVNNE